MSDSCDEVDSRAVRRDETPRRVHRHAARSAGHASSQPCHDHSVSPAGSTTEHARSSEPMAKALQQALYDVALLREHLERLKREKEALECELAAHSS